MSDFSGLPGRCGVCRSREDFQHLPAARMGQMLGGGSLGWVANVVPTDPVSAILEPQMHLLAAGTGGTEQRCRGPEAVRRPGWGQAGVPTPCTTPGWAPRPPHPGGPWAGQPRGAHFGWGHRSVLLLTQELAVIPSTEHPPMPAATPGNKAQWEASPGMPGKPVAGFFHSRDPSWRTRRLETPRTYCGPNFLGLGAEWDALHSHGAGPALQHPSASLPPSTPAPQYIGFFPSLWISTHVHGRGRGPCCPSGPKVGGQGVLHHHPGVCVGGSHPGTEHP